MKEIFKTRCQEIFVSYKGIKWFDKEGILNINDDLYISIKIDDIGYKNQYNGFHVDVYHRSNGLLKSKFFWFSDYLKLHHLMLYNKKLDWYTVIDNIHCPVPTTSEVKKYVDEIKEYIVLITSK